MRFSKRFRHAVEPSEFSQRVEQLRARGSALCDLSVSNPTQVGLPYESERLAEALALADPTKYEPVSLGARVTREALASLWASRNVSAPIDRIVLTSGTSESYGFLFKLLCDPGDEVLVPEPSYPLFAELARYDSVRLKPYRLGFDGAWHLDLDSVRAAMGPESKAILAVSPNNPTGSYVKPAEWEKLFSLGLPVVSDEVFWAYNVGAERFPSALECAGGAPSLVFALDGLSKYAALPHVKLGWITVAGPKELARAAVRRLELIADAYLSVNSLVQLAAPRLLQGSETTRNAIRSRIHRNFACVSSRAGSSSFSLLPLEGGWSAVLQLPNVLSDSDWVLGLLEDRNVLVQPGWFYDFTEPSIVVVSLLTSERQFEDGISQLAAYVDDRVRRG